MERPRIGGETPKSHRNFPQSRRSAVSRAEIPPRPGVNQRRGTARAPRHAAGALGPAPWGLPPRSAPRGVGAALREAAAAAHGPASPRGAAPPGATRRPWEAVEAPHAKRGPRRCGTAEEAHFSHGTGARRPGGNPLWIWQRERRHPQRGEARRKNGTFVSLRRAALRSLGRTKPRGLGVNFCEEFDKSGPVRSLPPRIGARFCGVQCDVRGPHRSASGTSAIAALFPTPFKAAIWNREGFGTL